MSWQPCSPSYPYFLSRDYHRKDCSRAAQRNQVPAWTAEDERNLARRVRRAAVLRGETNA